LSLAVGGVADEAENDDADGEAGQRLHAALSAIEQHVLDTNAGKQLSQAATDV
jgi:hypothetical protein